MGALDAFFDHYYRTHPVNATFTGVHTFDDALPDWSREARVRDVQQMRALAERLRAASTRHASSAALRDDAVALDLELARANLDVRIAEYESGHFQERNPALWTGEAIFGVASLMIRDFAPAVERLPAIRARLARVPSFLGTMRATITAPVPARWRDRAVRECRAAIDLFDGGLTQWMAESLDGHHDADASSVRAAAQDARDAFTTTSTWLDGCAIATDAAYSAGAPLLATLLERGHFCHESPHALLQRAEAAMEYERARLARMLSEHGTGWAEAQAAMAADCPTVAEYYDSFTRRWEKIRAGVMAAACMTWPEWPIRYVPIPRWARAAAPSLYWLFYRSPAPFDRYDVYDYVVTPVDASMTADEQARRLHAWNHSVITLNHVVHHGGVGHHLQNWHAAHRSSSRVGTVAAVDCASRIGMFLGGSMAEGWACYATELAEELGLLTSLETLSQQHTRVRQLARAIVDIRLHTGVWSFAEAADYYERQTGMAPDMAAAETTKNSMFPGTALMYWLGTDGILQLRAAVQQTEGASFSLRQFHDALLGRGSIPVPLITRLMSSPNAQPSGMASEEGVAVA